MTQDQPPLTVRAATASEATALARLFEDIEAQTITTAYVLERLNALQDLETPLLAEQDGEILGMASLRLLPSLSGKAPHAEVSELYVKRSRRGDQVGHQARARRAAHVDLHRALAAVQRRPVEAAPVGVHRQPADVDVAADRIDADDVGAELGHVQAGGRRGDEGGEFDDAKAVEDRALLVHAGVP